jgi:hypothetical protein
MTPGTYRALGGAAGLIGLSASTVATWFFVLGLLQTERDAAARQALVAAGVLLTVGQLAGFGLASALPRDVLRGLRCTLLSLGTALFLFEIGSMAVTQLALVQSADTSEAAAAARIEELQTAISNRRAVAAGRRELAATQAQAQAITAAARSLRQADEAEAEIAPLAGELQQLQASRRPTLSTLLGTDNTALFATLRSALIGLVGLVFMSAAGALFRTAREATEPAAVHELKPAAPAPAPLARQALSAVALVRRASLAITARPAGSSEPLEAPANGAPATAVAAHAPSADACRRLHEVPADRPQRRRRRPRDIDRSDTNNPRRDTT